MMLAPLPVSIAVWILAARLVDSRSKLIVTPFWVAQSLAKSLMTGSSSGRKLHEPPNQLIVAPLSTTGALVAFAAGAAVGAGAAAGAHAANAVAPAPTATTPAPFRNLRRETLFFSFMTFDSS